MKKKSQMEILGLVIIILLLTLGLLFVIRFVYLGDDTNIRAKHAESQLAANLLNSMLQTTAVECQNRQIRELFSDCGATNSIICRQDQDGLPERSCKFLETEVEMILDAVLDNDDWTRIYYFNASHTRQNLEYTMEFGTPCTGAYDSKFYPIQSAGRTMIVTLQICGIS